MSRTRWWVVDPPRQMGPWALHCQVRKLEPVLAAEIEPYLADDPVRPEPFTVPLEWRIDAPDPIADILALMRRDLEFESLRVRRGVP